MAFNQTAQRVDCRFLSMASPVTALVLISFGVVSGYLEKFRSLDKKTTFQGSLIFFFVRVVAAAARGSSGQKCLGYLPLSSFFISG